VAPEVVVGHLLGLLARMDTEYERDPARKIQILTTLSERKDPRAAAGAARFTLDANETVRFAAVAAVLAQDDAATFEAALVECLCQEESVRVRNRVLESLAISANSVGARREAVAARLTPAYSLDKSGVVTAAAGGTPRKKA
jgi:HEAT repeat protein